MLAGYLHKNGSRAITFTNGLQTDVEMRCAIRVARALDFEHRPVTVLPEAYPTCADHAARWEHLAGGFSMITRWGMLEHLRSAAPRVITGYLGDAIVGGSHIHWAYDPSRRAMSFASLFRRLIGWGIESEILKQLLRKGDAGDLVNHILERTKQVYEEGADFEFQRAWCFDLRHRQRFHVGHGAWELSFGAWPVMPYVDREVLETVAGLPAAVIA